MEYIIKSRSVTITDIVEYTKDDGAKVTVAVPVFDPQNDEEEQNQIIYRGNFI